MRKKVLIVDDHPLICEAIRQALLPIGFETVGETADGIDALCMIESLTPDIVILDIGLEKLDGLTVLKRITREELDVRVLVFTSQSKDSYATRCLQAGASGFVSKSESIETLTKAVKTVADGYVFFPKSAMPLLGKAKVKAESGLDDLTDRELQILKLLAEGFSNAEIAARLSLSNKTVSGHKVNIQTKLSVDSVIELGEIARRHHLV
ncbi:LuxR family transcriptional regulator [Comamonas testosteroni]|uniref:LuxR family transcriptional regulator n=1 Tax=Comamonas testosteroni TaxID=285 RepID=A0A0L7N7K2_COMTE|nr:MULTISPECIES: response regulator transcription factor [Comamonas]KOC30214.1 LuxR family transcriptional regulator [Comamonas testosteroni]KWT73052.1 DNA-binding response regulator, LuxR family [Comamonas testosteroni]MDN5507525.1 response regulator transcription factor [Comamonas sp.]MDN5538134.1 response regulator transcription factor [Comamonas sp.]